MPRTITIDTVELLRLQLLKTPGGDVDVEYHLKAGAQVVQAKHEQVTARLSAARHAGALAVFDGIAQDIGAAELA